MSYTSSSIKVLKGLEACRLRPGMYIGNTQDGSGLHHLIYEVLDNSIDEHLAKHCNHVSITLDKEGYATIEDNGRGIPVDIHEGEGISAAIVIMTQLHAGGKFNQDSYKISGGLHGVGVSVVNALADRLELTIFRDGYEYFVAFEKGALVQDLIKVKPTTKQGTRIKFKPDATIFGDINFDVKIVARRIDELSYLNPGLKVNLVDEREDYAKEFYQPDGIKAFVNNLMKNKQSLNDVIEFRYQLGNILIEGGAAWSESYSEEVHCFTNTIPQRDGGTHLVGLKTAFTRCVNNYLQKDTSLSKKLKDLQPSGDDIREGIVCVLAVYLPEPQFASQTKEKLVSASVRSVVEQGVTEALSAWFEENPDDAKKITSKIVNAALAREAARKSRDLVRNNKGLNEFSLSMATKLAGCSERDPTKTSLFIVEGDSAGGNAKQARDRKCQAVLPLRGKILNVEKANLNKMLGDEGIRTLIAVMGTGIGETFDITKIRYNKIVIMTDADVDGSHIFILLLTFFFKYMRAIIENGYLYIAQPPLYGVKLGQKMHYLLDDEALAEFFLERNLDKITLTTAGKKVEQDVLREYIKDLFATLNDIKSRHIIFEDFFKLKVCEESETFYDDVLALLNAKDDGIWTIKEDERYDNSYIFTCNNSGMKHEFPFSFAKVPTRYLKFVEKWANYWGNDIVITYRSIECTIHNPVELYNLLNQRGMNELHIKRYKGLGEMNPEDLEVTAMKSYKQISYDNEQEIEELLIKLMGDDVEPRKRFIEELDPIEADD